MRVRTHTHTHTLIYRWRETVSKNIGNEDIIKEKPKWKPQFENCPTPNTHSHITKV